MVSSSVEGDLEETSHILSAGVPADPEQREYALRRPRAFVRERARALGISDPVVGLITGPGPRSDPGGDLRRRGDLSGRSGYRPPSPRWLKFWRCFEAGVKTVGGSTASWTSLDAMVVASTGGGVLFSVGGTSTLVGNLIGLAVYDAVAEGVRLEQEASGKILGLRGRSEHNVGPDHVATLRASKWA